MNPCQVWASTGNKTQSQIIALIPESLIQQFNEWRQVRTAQNEACGVIIGERRGQHYLVTGFTPPMPTDTRTRYFCKRHIMGHQQIIDWHHEQSFGRIQYIGEWHSHPEKTAQPSLTDLREWNVTQCYLKKEQALNDMLCFILGTEKDWLGVYSHGELYNMYKL